MIVQCDQCSAKFRLDDSKVKDGGAKVRCSKCKHIFIVRKEAADETDVDSFLDGLVPSQPDTSREPVNAVPSVSSSSSGEAGMPADINNSGTSMSESLHEKDDFDFGDFTFETAPVSAPVDAPAASAAGGGFDFDDLTPDSTHHDSPETGPVESPSSTDLDFGGFSIESAPVSNPANNTVPPQPTVDFDFDEFNLEAETVGSQATAPDKPAPPGDFDFSPLSMGSDSDSGSSPFTEPPTTKTPFDFGEFDFDSSSGSAGDQNKAETGTVPVPDDNVTVTPATEQPFSGATGADDFFFSDDISPATVDAGSLPGETAIPFANAGTTAGTATSDAVKEMDFSATPDLDFTFEPEFDVEPATNTITREDTGMKPEQPVDSSGFGFAPASLPETRGEAPEAFSKEETHRAEESVSLADDPFGLSSDTAMPVFADEPPPLSISSRRRSGSILPMVVIAGLVILVIAMSIGGVYYLKEGPAVFNRVGLGFMASWFGAETREEGKIAVRNTSAQFMKNREAGEIFVINGEAVNNFDNPRASIQVKATVYGAKGEVLLQKTVYCGNALSKDQLTTMPLAELEKRVANPFGDSLANLAVQPGKGIPFVAVLANVPAVASDFGVEVVSSTVSSK